MKKYQLLEMERLFPTPTPFFSFVTAALQKKCDILLKRHPFFILDNKLLFDAEYSGCCVKKQDQIHYFTYCIREGFHGRDLMVVVGSFGLLGRVLKVFFPNVSPVSVAGIFRGQQTVLFAVL